MTASFIVRKLGVVPLDLGLDLGHAFSRGFRTRERSAMIPDRSFRHSLGTRPVGRDLGLGGRLYGARASSSFQPTFSRNRWYPPS